MGITAKFQISALNVVKLTASPSGRFIPKGSVSHCTMFPHVLGMLTESSEESSKL